MSDFLLPNISREDMDDIDTRMELYNNAYIRGQRISQLVIGFDVSHEGDHSCMTVFQRGHIPGQLIHVATFWDNEACELYEKLGGGQVVCGKDRLELLKELAETVQIEPYHTKGGEGINGYGRRREEDCFIDPPVT